MTKVPYINPVSSKLLQVELAVSYSAFGVGLLGAHSSQHYLVQNGQFSCHCNAWLQVIGHEAH